MAEINAFLILNRKVDDEEGVSSLLICAPDPDRELDNASWSAGEEAGLVLKATVNSALAAQFTEGAPLTMTLTDGQ